jgi:cytochrome b subunit of formate dehydrogenase
MKTREVQRWDRSQVRQHQLLVASVLLLVLTGMPLRYADTRPAQSIAQSLGGASGLALLHRIGALGLIFCFLWHLCYLARRVLRRSFRPSTLPCLKDFADAWHLALYLVGLRPTEPRYDRYSFLEKFDYWAATGGSVLMITTGLVLWFPDWANRIVGRTGFDLAFNLHSLESVLAALFLLIGHVYHVHLAGGLLPFNMVWLTGRMTEQEYREHHPVDWERTHSPGSEPKDADDEPEPLP